MSSYIIVWPSTHTKVQCLDGLKPSGNVDLTAPSSKKKSNGMIQNGNVIGPMQEDFVAIFHEERITNKPSKRASGTQQKDMNDQ